MEMNICQWLPQYVKFRCSIKQIFLGFPVQKEVMICDAFITLENINNMSISVNYFCFLLLCFSKSLWHLSDQISIPHAKTGAQMTHFRIILGTQL